MMGTLVVKRLMSFAAVANWKVETSVVQATTIAEKMVYRAYLHAKAASELVATTRKFQARMMLMIIGDL